MIVVEESNVRKTQLDPGFNVAVATSSTPLIPAESPPAYTPRQDPGPSSSFAHPFHTPPPPPATQKRQPKPAAVRFFEALLLALASYAAIAFVIQSLMHIIFGPPHDFPRRVGRPEPQDGTVIHCVGGEDWSPDSRVQFMSFSIPLNSSIIYVMGRGQQATGKVTVEPHQTSVSDEITVDIVAQYHGRETSEGINVCLMERSEGERGVGIFTPKHLTWTNRRSEVEVTVKIPHQLGTPVLEFPRFEILTPDFQVTFPDTDEFVNFRDLAIHASNVKVDVGSVRATNIDIKTSNLEIRGRFIAKSSLNLMTSNAPITANISLEKDHTSEKETSADPGTASGSTGAISPLSDTRVPRYSVRAVTTNAGLNLAFPSLRHPSSSLPILDIVGSTTNGLAEILLQSSFEGSFGVSTSRVHQADFSSGSTPESDPLGLGRQQQIDLTTSEKSRKEGRVYWGDLDDGRELGRVDLSTSNRPASLRIQ